MKTAKQDIETRVKAAEGDAATWWYTPDEALRGMCIQSQSIIEFAQIYPLDASKVVVPLDLLVPLLASVRAAEKKFEGYTTVVTLPGPIG